MKYSVSELFHSFQGEGVYMGQSAFFVRLMGCDQCCPFCDSAATWHKDWKPAEATVLSERQIVSRVLEAVQDASPTTFVVLTGGEPALYNLQPLVDALHDHDFGVHIETAGHKPLPRDLQWITVSPKFFATPPLPDNLNYANEIKLICTSPEQLEADFRRIRDMKTAKWHIPMWLHPEWSQRENPALLKAITEKAKSERGVRAGYQLHKIYKSDSFDPHSCKKIVPLGGVARD
jgi:organic radical activating enzyme